MKHQLTSTFLRISERHLLQHHPVAPALGVDGKHYYPERDVRFQVVQEEVGFLDGGEVVARHS